MDQKSEDKIRELRLAVRQLSALVEISVNLNASLDLKTVLSMIVREAQTLLDCEGASILLYDERRKALFFVESSGKGAEQIRHELVPIKGSLAGHIFSTQQVVINNHIDAEPRHYDLISKKMKNPVHSLLGVPLMVGEKSIGVLEAVNKRHGSFDEDDGGLLSIMASQAAVAIHNAQLLDTIRKAYEDVREADRLKTNFMALASHELRTPLGLIIGYASLMSEEFEGEVPEYASQILKAAMQMRSILEDMSSLTLLKKKVAATSLVPVDAVAAWQKALAELQDALKDKKHHLETRFDETVFVLAEADLLNRVLKNLLDNAIRFTPEGGRIVLGVARQSKYAVLWVEDNGIGLEKAQLEKIFREFYQVEDHMTRSHGGLGVGLSIAKALVESLNGRIWAESAGLGKGVRMNVRLPLAAAKTPPFAS